MKDAKGHGSNARGGAQPPVNPKGTGVQFGHGPIKNLWPDVSDMIGPGQAHTAEIAGQHGVTGPAVLSSGPRFDTTASRGIVGKGRGESFATSGGARAAFDLRRNMKLGG